MPFLDPKPDPFHRGQMKLSARELNAITQAVVRQIRGGQGVQVGEYGDRTTISSKPLWPNLQGISNYVSQFVVLEERDDYLVCTPFVPDLSDDEANWIANIYDADRDNDSITRLAVAKPYVLQKGPWDDLADPVIVNGTPCRFDYGTYPPGIRDFINLDTDVTTFQQITPSYFLGDIITAARLVSGVEPEIGYDGNPNNFPVAWMDINCAAREWFGDSGSASVPPTVILRGNAGGVAQTVPPATPTFLIWISSEVDTQGFFSAGSPTKITIPSDGYYHVGFISLEATPITPTGVGPASAQVSIVRNYDTLGTTDAISVELQVYETSGMSYTFRQTSSGFARLLAGDDLRVLFTFTAPGSASSTFLDAYRFWAYKVSGL